MNPLSLSSLYRKKKTHRAHFGWLVFLHNAKDAKTLWDFFFFLGFLILLRRCTQLTAVLVTNRRSQRRDRVKRPSSKEHHTSPLYRRSGKKGNRSFGWLLDLILGFPFERAHYRMQQQRAATSHIVAICPPVKSLLQLRIAVGVRHATKRDGKVTHRHQFEPSQLATVVVKSKRKCCVNKLPFGRSGGGRFNGAAAAVAAAGRLAAAGLDRRPYF